MRLPLAYKFLLFWTCLLVLANTLISYEGYSLLRVTPKTEIQLKHLLKLNANTSSGLDFWLRTTAVNNSADIMVFPWAKDGFIKEIEENGTPYSVLIPDLGKVIEEDMTAVVNVPKEFSFFSDYHSVEEMINFMKNLTDRSSLVKIEEIGSSYEERPLLLLRISIESGYDKPAIWIQCGAHSREMIGPAVCLFFALKLATCTKNEDVSQLIESFDWYIYPIVNPDGYEYARTTGVDYYLGDHKDICGAIETQDRLWRKTRSLNKNMPNCLGADANRNWNFHWSDASGASLNPCSHNYAGVAPFSEPETRAIAKYLQDNFPNNLLVFLDFHSYSQRWLTPWGYTSSVPENYQQQKELAETATSALKKAYGTEYSVGSSGKILYTVSGGARDWVYGVLGTPFSYVVELRDDGQTGGFLLPRCQILPTAEETWIGIVAMATKAAQEL